jgi:curved DNA-binding protein CbpA
MTSNSGNHYQVLGVDPGASARDIKAAYRSKARSAHPDKGGSSEEFAPIARAYEVLGDPDRRLLYDATGLDQEPDLAAAVRNTLMQAFHQALNDPACGQVVDAVREALEEEANKVPDEEERLEKAKERLLAKRDRVRASGTNLVHVIIDGEIKQIEAGLKKLEHKAELMAACLEAIESYEEDPEPSLRVQTGVWVYNTTSAGATYG